jgi:hypothetical protein
MSEEVLRFYQRGGRGGRGLRLGRKRRPVLRYIVLTLIAVVPASAFWFTRDTTAMGRLIPRDQQYALLFPDLIEGRKVIARSALWQALPPGVEAANMQQMLQEDFGLPEWLINNVAVGPVHVSGTDLEGFGDALIVTRMTRLGTLLQHLGRWTDAMELDPAGGLDLRRLKDAGLWLAVRGRVMLASRDRNALIRALVLTEEEALGEAAMEQTLETAAGEMLQARVRAEALPWASEHVSAAGLQCWLNDEAARAVLTCRLSDTAKGQWAPLLAKATPRALRPAPPGPLRISADLGLPAAQAWAAIASMFGVEGFDAAAAIEGLVEESVRPVAGPALRGAVEGLRSGWSISYRGINQMAFAPMPRFAGLFSADAAMLRALTKDFPPLPDGIPAWQSIPRLSADGRYVEMPLFGGDDLHPVLAPQGGRLLVATAKDDALELLSAAPPAAATEVKGNILVEVESAPLVQDALNTGLQLAELRLVRGHTPESLGAWFAPWQAAAERVTSATLVVSHEDGTVTLDLRLALRR